MDDPQQDALLEEFRKLRGEVRAVRHRVNWVLAFLLVCVVAVADKVKWLTESLIGTSLGFAIVGLIWVGWKGHQAAKEARKQKAPARVIITPQPLPKP